MAVTRAAVLSEVVRPLWLGCKDPIVASLAAYFDDSFRLNDQERGGVVAIAGYIAPVLMWDLVFDLEWWYIINNAPKPISEFKASDCRNRQKQFEGWTKAECTELTKKLVGAILRPDYDGWMMGVGTAIEIPYTQNTRLRKKLRKLAYTACASMTIIDMLEIAHRKMHEDDSLHLIFDSQPKLEGAVRVLFRQMRDIYEKTIEARIRLPQFEESVDLAPLQAADLLAYETFKEAYNRGLPEPRPISKALERLVEGRNHVGRFVRKDQLWEWRDDQPIGVLKGLATKEKADIDDLYFAGKVTR